MARPDNLTAARSGSRAVRAVGVCGKKGKGAAQGVTAVKKGAIFASKVFLVPHRFFTLLGYTQAPTRIMYLEYVGLPLPLISDSLTPPTTINCLHLRMSCMVMKNM